MACIRKYTKRNGEVYFKVVIWWGKPGFLQDNKNFDTREAAIHWAREQEELKRQHGHNILKNTKLEVNTRPKQKTQSFIRASKEKRPT